MSRPKNCELKSLHEAIESKNLDLLESLLKDGSDPNAVDDKGMTALNFICSLTKLMKIDLEIIQLLIQYGADVNTQDEDGNSPMMNLFCDESNDMRVSIEALKLLLKKGADVTRVNHKGRTIFSNIILCNPANLKTAVALDMLLKNGTDPNMIVDNETDETALNFICDLPKLTRVHLKMIQFLIQYKADVNTQDKYGYTPIMSLFRFPENYKFRLKVFKLLLENGADVTLVNHTGITILYIICHCNTANNPIILDAIELLLKIGIDVNVKNECGHTALRIAVKNCRDIRVIELLLKNGADPNIVDSWRNTPLHIIFAKYKLTRFHLEIVQLLIQYKANVNIQNKDGYSPIVPLLCASENYKLRLEICKLLQENGADVTLINNEGNTVLHLLFKNSAEENPIILEAVELLLKSGVDVNKQNENGCTALHIAVKYCKDIKVIDLLLKNGADPNIIDTGGRTALHSICCRTEWTEFYLEMIQLLIQYKADVNIRDKDDFSPIMNLFRYADDYKFRLKACELLFENGADVTLVNNQGYTILHYIFFNDEAKNPIILEAVELLFKIGIDVNVKNECGYTALHIAVEYCRDIRVIELLLKNDADPNIVDNWRNTPLHIIFATYKLTRFHLEMIQLLIQYKANVNIQDKDGYTPIMSLFRYAEDKDGYTPIMSLFRYAEGYELLLKVCPIVPLLCASENYKLRLEICKLLLENGADVTLINNEGDTVLHLIFKYKAEKDPIILETVKLFLERGVDVNIKDTNGKTALHHVVYCKQTKHVEFLLKSGADPNITDINGDIPLNYIFKHFNRLLDCDLDVSLKTYLEILKLNVEHNADPDHVGGDGKTVLHSLITELSSSSFSNFLVYNYEEENHLERTSKYVHQYVEVLLKHGLDVNVKDRDGFTALNLAVSYCNYDIAKILVEHGADVNTVQFKGGFLENKVLQSLNLLTTLNVLAIIELWQSKGFRINNHQYLTVFKFLTFHQDFKTNDDFYSWLFGSCLYSGRFDRLSDWIGHICEIGSGSVIRKFVEMAIRYDNSTCTNFDSGKIKKTLYTEINRYLYLIEYGNMYIDIETYNYLQNKLNLLVSENPEIDQVYREYGDKNNIDIIRYKVDLAKKMIISNNISYLDLCTSSPDKTYYLLQKCDYESAINSADFMRNFNKIGGIIRGYIIKALVRRFIKQSTTDSIKLLFHGILPDWCCDKIVEFLNVIDLVSVFEAVINCES